MTDYLELAMFIELTHHLKELNICENEINDLCIENFWIALHNNTTVLILHYDGDDDVHENHTMLSIKSELELNIEIKHEIIPNLRFDNYI